MSYLREEEGMADTDGDDDRLQLIEEIRDIFSRFDDCEKLFAHCYKMQNKADDEKRKENAVQMMTVHKSKGLEWQHVYVISMNDGYMPHAKAEGPEAYAEERRIAYVAITRPITNLNISYVAAIRNRIGVPSPFIKEMGCDPDQSEQLFQQAIHETAELVGASLLTGD